MARKSVTVELNDVPLNTRFRKFSGDRRSKVRDRAKVEVVQVAPGKFGVTVKRGIVTVRKGTVEDANLTVAKVRSAVRRDIKAGRYDDKLFDEYEKIQAAKKVKKK